MTAEKSSGVVICLSSSDSARQPLCSGRTATQREQGRAAATQSLGRSRHPVKYSSSLPDGGISGASKEELQTAEESYMTIQPLDPVIY